MNQGLPVSLARGVGCFCVVKTFVCYWWRSLAIQEENSQAGWILAVTHLCNTREKVNTQHDTSWCSGHWERSDGFGGNGSIREQGSDFPARKKVES